MKQNDEGKMGLFAPPLEKQLKEFNIPKEKTDEWETILFFIYRNHISGKITDKEEIKLYNCLFEEMKEYLQKESKNERN